MVPELQLFTYGDLEKTLSPFKEYLSFRRICKAKLKAGIIKDKDTDNILAISPYT